MMRYKIAGGPRGFELDRFEIETTPDCVSESVDAALSPSGRLRLDLASRNPAETVVTDWVYPDSFDEFRKLKAALFDEGFLFAARPLPDGMRIARLPSRLPQRRLSNQPPPPHVGRLSRAVLPKTPRRTALPSRLHKTPTRTALPAVFTNPHVGRLSEPSQTIQRELAINRCLNPSSTYGGNFAHSLEWPMATWTLQSCSR